MTMIKIDEPPNFLKYSNANPKVKITEEGVGVCSLVHSTLGVKRACWNPTMGTRVNDKQFNYSYGPTQIKQQVG
jgi:hypothetical protein